MVFTSEKKAGKSTKRLQFGQDVLTKVDQSGYKYLGILFTPDLKFDSHVLELVLPKARRVEGHVPHLLSKVQTGRCTFLRVLWLSKIHCCMLYVYKTGHLKKS